MPYIAHAMMTVATRFGIKVNHKQLSAFQLDELDLNVDASTVPAEGAPTLTREPIACMNISAAAIGASVKVIVSLSTVYEIPASCMIPAIDTKREVADPGEND